MSLWSMGDGGGRRQTVIDMNFCHMDLNVGRSRGPGLATWQIPWTPVSGWAVQPDGKNHPEVWETSTLAVAVQSWCALSVVTPQLRWNLFPWLFWRSTLAQAGSYLFRGGRPHNPASINCSIKYRFIGCPSAAFLTVLVLKTIWARTLVNRSRR